MSGDFEKLRVLFEEAVEQIPPEDWDRFLDEKCGDDVALKQQVEQLLNAHRHGGSALDSPLASIEVTQINPVTEQPGDTIGHYKLLQQIGEGGMGVVYMAEQTEPVERRVALKIIKPGMDTQQVIARFEAERQALAMMDHPNIAKVLDAGTTSSGRPYFVMELVKGMPVTQYCDEQHLSPRERLELFVPICQAVQHAHQKGIIHRDLKPSNILIAQYDDKPVPKIIDFGVAKAISHNLTEKTMFTQYGQIVGTLEYMSPEQARFNQLDVDTRSDIYSLGVLLYELLTGETPFDKTRLRSAAFDELLRIIREEEPPRMGIRLSSSELIANTAINRKTEPNKLSLLVRGELDWIVMKAMEKDRNRRYETATSFAADVQRYLADEALQACPPSAAYRFRKFVRRNKGLLVTTSVFCAALLVTVGGVGWALRDRAAQRAEIVREREAREAEIAQEQEQRLIRTRTQVELILADVDRLMQEQHWDEALTTVRRAEAVLASGDLSEDLQVRCRQVVNDLEMVARLEEIRLLASEIKDRSFDYEGSNRQYEEAFRKYGVDIVAMSSDEAAAWMRQRAAVLPALTVALDDWAQYRREVKDDAGSDNLTCLAQLLDADPWRRRLREILATKNNEALLEEFAASEEIARQAPSTVVLVAVALQNQGRPERALELLDLALREYPGDFWLHFYAGNAADSCRPRRENESIGYFRAALALRPSSVAVFNNLGNSLQEQKKPDEAIAAYHSAIELDPKYAKAYNNLGNALRGQKKLDEAFACYLKAIELDPKNALTHFNLGFALYEQKKLHEAIAAYHTAIDLDPKYAPVHNNLGVALYEQQQLDEAIACYHKAIELDPKHAPAHNNLGNALRGQKKLGEAIAAYRKAIELNPKEAKPHHNLGIMLKQQGNVDEAIACYRKAIELDQKFADAYFNLGVALTVQGKLDEAIVCYCKAIELDPQDALVHFNLGNALREQKKLDEAIACYRKAIELDPKYAPVHNNLGVALYEQQQLNEAIACYHTTIELDPKYANAFLNLGVALTAQGKLDEAIACYHTAIELDPKFANAFLNLGVALTAQGKLDEAIACYRKTIEIEPTYVNAYIHYANLLNEQQKLDEAILYYRKAIEIDPQNPHAFLNLGITLRRQGNREEGILCCRKAIEYKPDFTDAYVALGIALGNLGRSEESIDSFVKALDFKPNDELAHRRLSKTLAELKEWGEYTTRFRVSLKFDPHLPGAKLGLALCLNCQAWQLATDPNLQSRNPVYAIKLVQEALELSPEEAILWTTLGVARYRAGDWQESIDALLKGQELRDEQLLNSTSFFLAMAYWQLGDREEARKHYDHAVGSVIAQSFGTEAQRYFRAEAQELLGIRDHVRLEGHTSEVRTVGYFSDGTRSFSSGNDHTVRVWDLKDGKERARFKGDNGSVHNSVLSPDGQYVLTGSTDRTIRLWNVARGEEVLRCTNPEPVWSVAISSDGSMALAGTESTIQLWNLSTGEGLKKLEGHTDLVRAVAFSSDGRWAFSAGHDETVRQWDIETGKEVKQFVGHTHFVLSLVLTHDGRHLISGGCDRTVRIWDVETGKSLGAFSGHEGNIEGIALSPDGQRVFSGSADGTIRIWNLSDGRLLHIIGTESVLGLAVSPDGTQVISAHADKYVRLWTLPEIIVPPLEEVSLPER